MKKKQQSIISKFFKSHVVDALSFMAMGLFCSLILGLIIKQIALIPGLDFLSSIAALLQSAPVVGGSIGMAIGMIALSVLSFCDVIGVAALIFIIIYTASFMMSWGPICWVLISEIFPNTIRGNAVAIAVAAQWISNYIISSTFPSLDWSVGGTYLIYGAFSILSAIFVLKMVPETKGKTLEEMSSFWKNKNK